MDAAQCIKEDAMASILNNVSALGASRQLGITGIGLQKTIQRLTTGRRINTASDDAAGLAISNKLGADIRIATQARRNANDAVSYLQVADGVLDEVTNLLTRAAELAEQAKTGTISNTNRSSLDLEFQNIITSIADIGLNTKFNATTIFGATLTVSVATFSQVGVTVATIASAASIALGLTATTNALTVIASASTAAGLIASALDSVSSVRATLGASQQQLSSIQNSLGIQVENYTAAYSGIRDANIADEVVNLTKFQILNQSGTSALAQANQQSQSILALLR
jgi:flagellin